MVCVVVVLYYKIAERERECSRENCVLVVWVEAAEIQKESLPTSHAQTHAWTAQCPLLYSSHLILLQSLGDSCTMSDVVMTPDSGNIG